MPLRCAVPALVPLCVIVALLGGCGDATEAKPEASPEPAVPVATSAVIRGDIDASYKGTATILADAEATVVARVGGIVETIDVEEGQTVEAGAVLARLDEERLKFEAARARAQFEQLQSEHQRNEKVLRQNLISREVYDRSRFELQAARAALDLAELNLREAVIRAPIAGVISARHIKLGNMVQPQQALFHITDLSALQADLHVPEAQLQRIRTGQQARMQVDAWPGEDFSGRVLRINPVVDAGSGTVKVTVALDNPEGRLLPGMFGRLEVRTDTRTATLLIPKDAVLLEDGRASLFVVRDGRAERREVSLGYSNGRYYEIIDGVSDNEQVVTTGRASLKDGAAVTVVRDTG